MEDSPAAQPPDLSKFETEEPSTEYEIDENGNLIDPETGEGIEPAPETGVTDPESSGTITDPENPDTTAPGESIPVDPGETDPDITAPGTTDPETPDQPIEEDPGAIDQPLDFGPAPGEEGDYMPPVEPDIPIEPETFE